MRATIYYNQFFLSSFVKIKSPPLSCIGIWPAKRQFRRLAAETPPLSILSRQPELNCNYHLAVSIERIYNFVWVFLKENQTFITRLMRKNHSQREKETNSHSKQLETMEN